MRYLRIIPIFLGCVLFFSALLQAEVFYKYSYLPKKVYQHQLFPVTVIGIGDKGKTPPQFHFDTTNTQQPLFQKPLVIHNGNDSFYTFYFQADRSDIRIPTLSITSKEKQTALFSQHITVEKLQNKKNFSQVLAADLKIKNAQVSNYDEANHIVTLSLEAYEANIEDIKLSDVKEYGIEDIHRNFAKVSAEFYVIIPATQKNLQFSYFNTIKKQYIEKNISTIVQDSSVATQSDLNPKDDSFEKLKKYILVFFAGFFFLMFLLKKDFFYLVFAVISVITLLSLYIPHKKICVTQGASLYILPTYTSTVSTTIETTLHTPLLGEHDGYKKIEYKQGILGWIKNEDLCQN